MKVEELFGQDLIKKINKERKYTQKATDANQATQKEFIRNFSKQTLSIIEKVISDEGQDAHKKVLSEFYSKVNAGNYAAADIEMFRNTIEPFMERISECLEKKS